jgi:hypothetical protein
VVSVPEKTYELTFLYKEGRMDKGQVFSDLPTALEAFRCFVEPASADIYSGITLTEYDPSIALALEGFTYGRYVGWLV